MNNDLDRRLLLGAAGLAGISALAAASKAGPLNPPAGAIASTGKPIGEVEPRTPIGPTTTPGDASYLYIISQPGSYYLTGNVNGVVGKGGIRISASGVTLDLMGFAIKGSATAPAGPNGIVTEFGVRDVSICNGSVSGWQGVGVSAPVANTIVSGVRSSGNVTGFIIGQGGVATDCVSAFNSTGFSAFSHASFTRCSAAQNTGLGFNTIGTHTDCVSVNNANNGFQSAGIFRGCTASQNNGAGFALIGGSLVQACIATSNTSTGFSATDGCMIKDCVSNDNTGHGISAAGRSVIHGNVCTSNDQHGIAATSARTRIEMNHCTNNNRGIDMSAGTGNTAIHNTVGGNTSFGYAQGTGNLFGPNVVPSNNQINVGTNPHTNYEA